MPLTSSQRIARISAKSQQKLHQRRIVASRYGIPREVARKSPSSSSIGASACKPARLYDYKDDRGVTLALREAVAGFLVLRTRLFCPRPICLASVDRASA
jgi:hypothetical protein